MRVSEIHVNQIRVNQGLGVFYIIVILLTFFTTWNKIKSNSLLTVWYALRPSQQHTLLPNYSQSIKTNIGPSEGRTIIPSSHCPTEELEIVEIQVISSFLQKEIEAAP